VGKQDGQSKLVTSQRLVDGDGGLLSFGSTAVVRIKADKHSVSLCMFQILIISDEDEVPYMRPPLSKELWYSGDPEAAQKFEFKQWNGKWRNIFFENPSYYCNPSELSEKNNGVAVALNTKVS